MPNQNQINVIVIPADESPCFATRVDGTFEAYRKIVPGWDETTLLEVAPSLLFPTTISIYLDEEFLFRATDEPQYGRNSRVTKIIGHSNDGYGHWGDALIAGPPDERGHETSVPQWFADILKFRFGFKVEQHG